MLVPLSAHASIIYDWTGNCQRILFGSDTLCSRATLHVVTTDADAYIPGELFFWTSSEVQHSTLLEIAYADDNVTADLLPRWRILDFAFQLPASSPDGGSLSFEAAFFQSDATGVWRFESEEVFPHCDRDKNFFCSYGVTGVNGVWTRVPAPSTLVLLGVGLAGLVFSRRQQVR